MFTNSKIADFFLRMAGGIAIGVLFGWLLSAATYSLSPIKENAQRQPQRFDLVIPYGTAAQVKEGAYNPSLPETMSFVQGDILVVKNEDTVAHQLGPLFIPPSTSSVLNLDTANQYQYECSFVPSKTIGLTVQPRVTTDTRFQAILAIGLPSGMMLGVYSYLYTGKKKKDAQ